MSRSIVDQFVSLETDYGDVCLKAIRVKKGMLIVYYASKIDCPGDD